MINSPTGTTDLWTISAEAADYIRQKTSLQLRLGLVLGSGLGAFADDLSERVIIPYAGIPHFPVSSAEGHAGNLVIGKAAGVAVAVMQGRVHYYEGHAMSRVTFPIRVMCQLGLKGVLLTNAAGGISPNLKQGGLVVLSDHINLQGSNPLVGPNDSRFGPRFPDMTEAYAKDWRALALREGKSLGVDVQEGVYAAVAGPSYETPAEIRFLRTIGADVVGMSTAAEVIVARHCGMKVLAISVVTNAAAGILDQPINHEEVLETGRRIRAQFAELLTRLIPQMSASLA